MGPAIDHEGLDRGLDWDMGLEQKSMLHMELLQPPMLLFTTRMLPLPLDPFSLYLYLHLDLYLELEGMLLDKVVLADGKSTKTGSARPLG